MQEFSSISVSSYEAGSLADRLTEQSRDGWSVAGIVPTGNTITAYLCRERDAAAVSSAAADTTPEPATESVHGWSDGGDPALPSTTPIVPSAVEPEPPREPATETTPAAVGDLAASEGADAGADGGTATSNAGGAPAGWYADPSGRFELRYWDGGQWTEHVSRAGQQYTDPPIA